MGNYTVKQLARLSGISVRTLHHYDEIGLLRPAFTGENRYRYYGREELLRLQDILFHRELGVPLQDIGKLLELQGSDRVAILSHHREMLADRLERSRQLIRTIDRTIAELNGAGTMNDKDLYHGFAPEKQAEYEEWLVASSANGRARDPSQQGSLGQAPRDMQRRASRKGRGRNGTRRTLPSPASRTAELAPALDRHRAGVAHVGP
jgi:DNA-binding transcriptional MerR regulator